MLLAVTGATGHMGQAVTAAARDRGHDVVAFSRAGDRIDGMDAHRADAAGDVLAERAPDALVDFTVPEASVDYVGACAATATPAVVGTTGFSDEQLAALDRAAETTAVLRASNFARGVAVLRSLVADAAGSLEGYDVELTETHHNRKRDAPSGTALSLLDAVDDATHDRERVYGRRGERPRHGDEVGVHVRRAGTVHGEHELLFAGNDEALTLTHRAESRSVFAEGALDAAEWLAGRPPGAYAFEEVVASDGAADATDSGADGDAVTDGGGGDE